MVAVIGKINPDAALYYPAPKPVVKEFEGLLLFGVVYRLKDGCFIRSSHPSISFAEREMSNKSAICNYRQCIGI